MVLRCSYFKYRPLYCPTAFWPWKFKAQGQWCENGAKSFLSQNGPIYFRPKCPCTVLLSPLHFEGLNGQCSKRTQKSQTVLGRNSIVKCSTTLPRNNWRFKCQRGQGQRREMPKSLHYSSCSSGEWCRKRLKKRSKVKEIIVLIKARSFLDELNLEHLTSWTV